MTKDIEREHTKYLAELLEREVIKKDDFEDIVFKPEINAFHSNYLSARFMDNINFGWSSWQAAKAHEAKKLEGCVVVPEWISTRDYLPEEGVEVLVHRYGQIIQATKDKGYAGGFKERNCYGWQATFDVTYWMPKNFKLPDSYSFYYNDEHPYRETMLEAARGGNE